VQFRDTEAVDGVTVCHAGYHACAEEDRGRVLRDAVDRLNLAGAHCRLVLSPFDYRMLQTVAPEVPEQELRDALRWRVQEMIDFPAGEAAIEYYRLPSPRQAGEGTTLAVLVCRSDLIRAHSELCEGAGLNLGIIDIPELALRNLGARLPECRRGVALLSLQEERGTLQLQKGEEIYISRGLSFGSGLFEGALAGTAAGDEDAAMERLALEVQRSLDYYESFFGQSPVAGLVVTPIAAGTQQLVDGLNRSLAVIARAMDLGALVSWHERLDDATQQKCLTAVGAALREAGVT